MDRSKMDICKLLIKHGEDRDVLDNEGFIDTKLLVNNKTFEAKFYRDKNETKPSCCGNLTKRNLAHCWAMAAHVDLVSFKPFNDQFGYKFGDGVLRAFCLATNIVIGELKDSILRSLDNEFGKGANLYGKDLGFNSKKADIVLFRHGGEEFSILLIHEGFCKKLNNKKIRTVRESFFNRARELLGGLCVELYDIWKNDFVLKVWRENKSKDEYEYEVKLFRWVESQLYFVHDKLQPVDAAEYERVKALKPDFYLSKLCIRFGVANEPDFCRKSAEKELEKPKDPKYDELRKRKMYTDIERGVIHEETEIHFGEYVKNTKNGIRLIDHAVLFWIYEDLVDGKSKKGQEDIVRNKLKESLKKVCEPLKEKINQAERNTENNGNTEKLIDFHEDGEITYIVIETCNIVRVDDNSKSDNVIGDLFIEHHKKKMTDFRKEYETLLEENGLLGRFDTLIGDFEINAKFLADRLSNTKYRLTVEKHLRELIERGIEGIGSNKFRFLDLKGIHGSDR